MIRKVKEVHCKRVTRKIINPEIVDKTNHNINLVFKEQRGVGKINEIGKSEENIYTVVKPAAKYSKAKFIAHEGRSKEELETDKEIHNLFEKLFADAWEAINEQWSGDNNEENKEILSLLE